MKAIDPQFKKDFSEMEKKHLHLHERLNAWREIGVELEERLNEELAETNNLSCYHSLTDRLGAISEHFNTQEKECHYHHVKSSTFYKIIQEAPITGASLISLKVM